MQRSIVQSTKGVTLIGGGATAPGTLEAALSRAPVLVAADGGADLALAAGRIPDAVIGDFDSVSEAAMAAIPADRQHRVPEQETTDLGKCLRLVSAPFMIGLGFLRPRADHALAAWNALAAEPARRCILIGEGDLGLLCPPDLSLDLAPGTRLSLFPLGPARVESDGLRWPTRGLHFTPAGRIGTSNTVTGPVRLAVDGPMLLLLPEDCLDAVLSALQPPSPPAG